MNSFGKKSEGFTLIEVLVASLILFMTLSVFTMILRSALISNERALETVQSSLASTLILDNVSYELKSKHTFSDAAGDGLIKGTEYSWSATVKKAANPPATYLGAELIQADHQMKVWEVILKVKNGNRQSEFTYLETTW